MYFKDGERGTAQCEKLESIEGGRGTVISSKSGAGGKFSSLYAACKGSFILEEKRKKSGAGGKGLFIRTVNVTIFVSGTFDPFDVMCQLYHKTVKNPFLNGTKRVTLIVRVNEA